ncbi:YqgQ family protein [Streptococcus sp. ZJ93]|uniref:YqgQ family protein n=1 Tax=Streptococcus handemini TaxID=3161188 RepID=UPI0032F01AAE
MKKLYDVQQLLKQFGIIIYMGNRLYDIEMMQIELQRIYEADLLDRVEYMEAELVLRREHRLELNYQGKKE